MYTIASEMKSCSYTV